MTWQFYNRMDVKKPISSKLLIKNRFQSLRKFDLTAHRTGPGNYNAIIIIITTTTGWYTTVQRRKERKKKEREREREIMHA